MKLSSWRYILPEPFISLRRNIGMTIAAIMTVVLTLYLCGVFALLVSNIDRNADAMEASVEIKVFIEDGINQEQMDALSARVKSLDGVESVRYVSRADGLKQMSILGDDVQLSHCGGNCAECGHRSEECIPKALRDN